MTMSIPMDRTHHAAALRRVMLYDSVNSLVGHAKRFPTPKQGPYSFCPKKLCSHVDVVIPSQCRHPHIIMLSRNVGQ